MASKIVHVEWLSVRSVPMIGIVVTEDEVTGRRLARLGKTPREGVARSEEEDAEYIKQTGEVLSLNRLRDLVRVLEGIL